MHKPKIDLRAESVITNIFFLWKHKGVTLPIYLHLIFDIL